MKKSKEMDTWHYWEMILGYARKVSISCYLRGSVWQIHLSFLLRQHVYRSHLPCPLQWCLSLSVAAWCTQCCGTGIQSSLVSRTEGKRWRHISWGLSHVSGELMFRVMLCNAGPQILSNRRVHVFCNNYLCVCVCLWNAEYPQLWDPRQGPPLLRYKVQGYICIIIHI